MHPRALVIFAALLLAFVTASPPPAAARPSATVSIDAELVTVHATTRGPAAGARTGKRRRVEQMSLGQFPALSRPPFAAYTQYRVMRRSTAILATGMAWKTRLPNGRDLMIGLKAVIVDKKKRTPPRYVVTASLGTPGSSAFKQILETQVAAGETFFIPADPYRGGLVVVSVRLLEPERKP